MEATDEIKLCETFRSIVYQRLADAFRLPEPGLVEGLPELEAALANLGSGAHEDAVRMRECFLSSEALEALKIDYTRLFLGPFLAPAPPYGSVYLEEERRIMGDSTVDARRHYRQIGLDLAEGFKEAPDHVAVELEFLHALTCRVYETIESGDRQGLNKVLDLRKRFLERHIGQWMSAFCERLNAHAQTAFYRHLALAADRFLREELDEVHDPVTHGEVEPCLN